MQCSRKGFSLIELMIVVVIVGILASIAVSNFMAMQDRAREAKVKDNAYKLQFSIEDWAMQHDGQYPSVPEAAGLIDSLNNSGYFHDNPFGGGHNVGLGGWMLAEEGMVMYFAPAAIVERDSSFVAAHRDDPDFFWQDRQYEIDCHGKNAVRVMTLSND